MDELGCSRPRSCEAARTVSSGDAQVVLDLRPLQGGDSGRGIGATVRGVAGCFPDAGAILWRGFPTPAEATGRQVTWVRGPRRSSRMSWASDAASGRFGRDRSARTLWHLMNADASYDRGGPYVVTINDTIPWRFPDLYPAGPTGRLRMALTARMARKARVVVAPSRVSADDVVRYLEVPLGGSRSSPGQPIRRWQHLLANWPSRE